MEETAGTGRGDGARQHRGRMAYLGGLAAERQVAEHYRRGGRPIAAQRWRGRGGEVDLIAREGEGLVFVEVKRARTHDRAVQRLSRRQMDRLYRAASEYIAREPRGLQTPVRFDVALVDEMGRIRVIENAFGLDMGGW